MIQRLNSSRPSLCVVAVPGRFYPAGLAETWIGWQKCSDGSPDCDKPHAEADCECGYQAAEEVLPRGTGPGDAPALDYIVTDPETGLAKKDLNGKEIRRIIPARVTGRDLRMRRSGPVMVADHPIIRHAIIDGDLQLYVETIATASPEMINEAANKGSNAQENG